MGFTYPIIFMTGSREEVHRNQAMDFGCAAFLLKPFPTDRLIEAVAKATSSKRH
jgi:CheY-like chemotaxis protein